MISLNDFKQDITSLESEISELDQEYEALTLKYNELLLRVKDNKRGNDDGEGKQVFNNEEMSVPAAIEHQYFDPSIARFFDVEVERSVSVPATVPVPVEEKEQRLGDRKRQKIDDGGDQEDAHSLLSKINLENLYRLNTITAFPINDPSLFDAELESAELKSQQKDFNSLEYLGIRFDLFNNTLKKFHKPHYIILKKIKKNNNWQIFKTTIPNYIELSDSDKWLNVDLRKFATTVRRKLILIQVNKEKRKELELKLAEPATSS
ncbi:hypothetical protein PACTADRAFT_34182 [Pachysolen tannophilus NRRL Y-2460]|uniref:Uncharacterized protein n=1 Tax=Pachysolen tannophilus NRRL Y-2460 TaxID=669874 RepID=A0A1E4TV31_PACTA|nr:hypothetical protein PACTADRAFT_34182 [Pachysolen tannophilus NRRL Y-2460]